MVSLYFKLNNRIKNANEQKNNPIVMNVCYNYKLQCNFV